MPHLTVRLLLLQLALPAAAHSPQALMALRLLLQQLVLPAATHSPQALMVVLAGLGPSLRFACGLALALENCSLPTCVSAPVLVALGEFSSASGTGQSLQILTCPPGQDLGKLPLQMDHVGDSRQSLLAIGNWQDSQQPPSRNTVQGRRS